MSRKEKIDFYLGKLILDLGIEDFSYRQSNLQLKTEKL